MHGVGYCSSRATPRQIVLCTFDSRVGAELAQLHDSKCAIHRDPASGLKTTKCGESWNSLCLSDRCSCSQSRSRFSIPSAAAKRKLAITSNSAEHATSVTSANPVAFPFSDSAEYPNSFIEWLHRRGGRQTHRLTLRRPPRMVKSADHLAEFSHRNSIRVDKITLCHCCGNI